MSENQLSAASRAELQLAIAAEARLREALPVALADGAIDPTQPSRLPGWTVGHVLSHLARNADSHRQMLAGEPQYGGSVDTRNADIDQGAARTADELVADVVVSSNALVTEWGQVDWKGTATRTLGAVVPRASLPLLRLREVEIHRTDLGLPSPHEYTFDHMATEASEYVRRDLRQLEMIYKSRLPMGMTGTSAKVRALTPARRLAWLMGRVDVDGLPAANLFR